MNELSGIGITAQNDNGSFWAVTDIPKNLSCHNLQNLVKNELFCSFFT